MNSRDCQLELVKIWLQYDIWIFVYIVTSNMGAKQD